MAPDTAAVAAFLRSREGAEDSRLRADHERLWEACRRERWNCLTVAAAFHAVREWHERDRSVPHAGAGVVG